MNVIRKGTLLPLVQSESYEFDPARGYIHRIDYKGSSQSQMLSLQQLHSSAGIASRLHLNQGDSASLEVEDATMQYTLDTWQILGNDISVDIFQNPIFENRVLAEGRNLSKIIVDIRTALAELTDPTVLFGTGGQMAGAPDYIQEKYRLALRGATDYRRCQYVLRHTTNAPNRWSANIADVGVERIYTPAQLLTEVMSTALWIFPLPGRLQYKIAQIPAPIVRTNYLWGWLKSSSTETTSPYNRIEITTEYTLEQWTTSEYVPF